MSEQQRSHMSGSLPASGGTGRHCYLPQASRVTRGALAAASFMAAGFIAPPAASAVPSFARQAGQPRRISRADAFRLLIVQLWVTFVLSTRDKPFAAAVTSGGG